jgi:hypothetical protein
MLTVVRTADYPWQLVVEKHSSDVVQMAVQSEQASASLVGPDFNLVVITTRDEPALVSVYDAP